MLKHKTPFQLNLTKAEQARKILEADPHFKQAVLAIQSKWRIFKDDTEREGNLSELPETKAYATSRKLLFSHHVIKKGSSIYKDVLKILKQFALNERDWFDSISHYVLYNKFHNDFMGIKEAEAEPFIVEGKDPISKLPTISIKLGRNTTIEDIKDIWPLVRATWESYEKEPSRHKFGYRKNFNRNYDIYRLYGLTGKGMSKEVLESICKEIRVKYKEDLPNENIKKIISEMKKEFDRKPSK